MPWNEDYCITLCPVYKALGGDCADLGCIMLPDAAANKVIDEYNAHGLPGGKTNTQKCTLLGDLNNLEAELALPGNTLQAQTTTDLGTMIAGLRADIGLVPGCPN